MKLQNKIAIVTGGSRGIGRAICLRLAAEGANVVINYAGNQAAAEQTVADCVALGVQAIAVKGDVANAADCAALFDAATSTFGGRVDILVNNAGITRDGLAMRMSEEDFAAVIDTNLKGAFLCSKLAAKLMLKQRAGRIIAISSVSGLHGNAGQANYAASKAGVIAMTRSIAKELAVRGVTANVVAPGFIATDMTDAMPQAAKDGILPQIPMNRIGNAEEVAAAVAFLASDEASYISGQVLAVDGGMTM